MEHVGAKSNYKPESILKIQLYAFWQIHSVTTLHRYCSTIFSYFKLILMPVTNTFLLSPQPFRMEQFTTLPLPSSRFLAL